MRVLSNDCLPDVLSLLDRPTLDTLLVTDRIFRNVISTKMKGVCLREIVHISVERRIEYGYFSWMFEVPEASPDWQALKRFDVNFLLRDMEPALSDVFKNCCVSDHVVLHHVILTPEFLKIFVSLFKGVRVRGFLSLSDVSAPASVSPKQLIDAFDGVNIIVLRGQKFLQHQLSDEFLRACFDKGAGVVDLPYGRNAYLRELSTDAILDFCFDSGGVADYEMAYLRRRSVIVQGVVLPNDFVRKCVEKHLACPFTNPLSIRLEMVENIDHQELAEIAAFTDPSIRPSINPFKITLVTRGMKLRIHGSKLAIPGFHPEVSEEVEECCDRLRAVADEVNAPLDIRPLFGALPSNMQNDALEPAQEGRRNVVVATNIAETSLTINGIVHVIDSGLAKVSYFDPETGFYRIAHERVSKYSAIQRAGRAGRVRPGKCYRLYSQQQYEEMPTSDSAEITRADLAKTLLRMSKLNITDVMSFPFMQKPSTPYFVRAVSDLVAIGAMDGDRLTITTHGEKITKLALEPCLANALIRSAVYGCAEEMLIIVALISVDYTKVFYKPRNNISRNAAKMKWRELRSDTGDHLTLLNVYRSWTVEGGCERQWCEDNFIYFQTMLNAKKLVDQIGGRLALLDVPRKSCGKQYDRVQAALAASFADRAASFEKEGRYVWLADKSQRFERKARVMASIDSVLQARPLKLVICYKVIGSSSPKMHLVTQVEKHMLPESVRAKVPGDTPWTPGIELKQAWLASQNPSEASTRRASSLVNDNQW